MTKKSFRRIVSDPADKETVQCTPDDPDNSQGNHGFLLNLLLFSQAPAKLHQRRPPPPVEGIPLSSLIEGV